MSTPALSISARLSESVMPPAHTVVPSVPSVSMESRQAPLVFVADTAKLSAISWDGPPCPVITQSSEMVVTDSPTDMRAQGGGTGR